MESRKGQQRSGFVYRIDRTAGKVIRVAVYTMFVLVVLGCIHSLLNHLGFSMESEIFTILKLIYKYVWWLCGGVFVVGVICRIALSPFVKSEEEEQFEKQIAYVLEQRQMTQAQEGVNSYSPLCHLTAEQEERVKQVLHDLNGSSAHPEAINLALIARYLTALEQMGKAHLTDKHALRLWVQRVTEKTVPNSSQFNEAIPSTNRREVSRVRAQLEKLLISER